MTLQLSGTRVVVTGGAGFIGSHVVDRLLCLGADVLVVDDFSTGRRENLAHHSGNPRLEVVRADILEQPTLVSLFRHADFVLHLATRSVRRSLRQPTEVHEVNTTGTLNVLKAASTARVKRLLYCSSSEVNGTAGVVPMTEDYAFKPETIYGASKLAGEYYAQVFHRSGWLSTVIARPHNNYGPRAPYAGSNGEVIPRFILWALVGKAPVIFGDGLQTRDFTYVIETAELLVEILLRSDMSGSVFNVCRGQEVSILEIAEIIAELTGLTARPIHLPGRPNDVRRLWGDPTRLRECLGSVPTVSIRDGLARTVDWFRENVAPTPETLNSMAAENWEEIEPESWLVPAVRAGEAIPEVR